MDKINLTRDKKLCTLSIFIIVISYAAEKLIELFVQPGKTMQIVLAMVYTVLLLCVTLILGKTKECFSGLLAALIGYKMMPVPMPYLSEASEDASMLYFIVKKAAVIIFLVLVFRLYNMQEKPTRIKALPILMILFAVPFFNEIGVAFTAFFEAKTGSMILGYFTQYICYIAATLIILGVAYISGYGSLRFAAYFEYAALGINILRNAGKAAVKIFSGVHVSKSIYGWIFVYVVLVIGFIVALSLKKKQSKEA